MSVQRRVKWLLAGALALTLTGCSAQETDSSSGTGTEQEPAAAETIKVLVPSGAPALGMLGAFDQDGIKIEVVEGTDVITAELAKSDSSYDVIVAPVNLGVKVWSQTETYALDGILTWGNLYMVGTEENQWEQADVKIAAFGEGAVPGMVFGKVLPEASEKAEYYPSVAEAQQALLAGQADCALLAQPAAAAAIAKGKEQDLDLQIIADLQSLWQEEEQSQEKGYPQAAVFVKQSDAAKADTVMEKVTAFLDSADADSIEARVEEVGADTLGAPSAKLAASTWQAQNIHFEKASGVKEDIASFLKIFGMELPEGILLES